MTGITPFDSTLSQTEGAREARARRLAYRLGYNVRKNCGGFVVIDLSTYRVVAGGYSRLTLDELEQHLALEENAQEFEQELAEGES